MIGEILNNEALEIKTPSVENYTNIKPEGNITAKEADDYWKGVFAKEHSLAEQRDGSDSSEKNDAKEAQKKDITELVKDYIEDLKSKSECPETIPEDALDTDKLEIRLPDKVAEMRDEFDDKKADLRKEWENIHEREWPKYENDVTNGEGKVIRKAGDNYDAHHIHSLQTGGENVASNITPMDVNSHREIHSSGGSCTAVVDKVKGGD